MTIFKKLFKSIFGVKPKNKTINDNYEDLEIQVNNVKIEEEKSIKKRTKSKTRKFIQNEVFDLQFSENYTELIRKHLINHGSINNCIAIRDYKVYRLSAIIFELRKRGMDIKTCFDKDFFKTCDFVTYKLLNNPYETN
jgi:hypothetical protein